MWPSSYCLDHNNHLCVYQGEDSCVRRKGLEASTSLQIYWVSQVER